MAPLFVASSAQLGELETLIDWEWLETNGTGGFAMGTVATMNTRRYHGLLVASLRPPVERYMMLSRLEERALHESETRELGVNQYPGVLHPNGTSALEDFRLDPMPCWTYRVGGVRLRKWLFLIPGEQTVVVRYSADGPLRLQLRPLLAFRDYHSLAHANRNLDGRLSGRVERNGQRTVTVRPYSGLPELSFRFRGKAAEAGQGWYFRTQYRIEEARGLDFEEDLWCAGLIELDLSRGTSSLVASVEPAPRPCSEPELDGLEEERRARGGARLETAADAFRAKREKGQPTLMAGFPWFADWGRDAMISTPGLLLGRGLIEEAHQMLRGFLDHMSRGLIPNRFPDTGETPEYNTADATLWMFHAAESLTDTSFLKDVLYPRLKDSIRWHLQGTHHDIRVDPSDDLLSAGGPGTQLTWMDAKVGDQVMTPRHGKPVEINALWFNALKVIEGFATQLGLSADAEEFRQRAARVASSFQRTFWNPERNCLFDVVRSEGNDPSLRPNQIIAVSLPHSPLLLEQMKAVVDKVEQTLLTPYGLRTLAPSEPGYRGRYEGNPYSRDSAYHQGTVWPWLLGPFVDAYLRVHGSSEATKAHCRRLLHPLRQHLDQACLGQISEVFDGDPPHLPKGAPAQAWSVAELLRLTQLLG